MATAPRFDLILQAAQILGDTEEETARCPVAEDDHEDSEDLEGEEEGDDEEDDSPFELAGEGSAALDSRERPSTSGLSRSYPRRRRRISTQVESRKQQANEAHNLKERQRRKDLKQAVLRLRNQLRRKTRKPSTISVLKAAQQEITELKRVEGEMDQELDAQKKKHSFLQWRLERLVSEHHPVSAVRKLPTPSRLPRNCAPLFPPHPPPPLCPNIHLPNTGGSPHIPTIIRPNLPPLLPPSPQFPFSSSPLTPIPSYSFNSPPHIIATVMPPPQPPPSPYMVPYPYSPYVAQASMFPALPFYLPNYALNPATIIRPVSTFMHHDDSSTTSNGYDNGRRSWESSGEDSDTQPRSSQSSNNGSSSVLSNSPHHHSVISWSAPQSSHAHTDSERESEPFSREEEELIVDDIESPVSASTGSSSHHSRDSNLAPPDLQLQELCRHIKDEQDEDDDPRDDGGSTFTGLQPKNLPLPPLRRDRNADMISRVIEQVRPQRTLLSEHTVETDSAIQTHNSLPFLGSESKDGGSLQKWHSLNRDKSRYNHGRWKKGKKNGQKDSISICVTTVFCS